MLTIGLCGQTGSGKSTVADFFLARNIPVIDADKVYRELTDSPSPCLDAIVRAFGSQALTEEGRLNRPYLREVVFASNDSSEKRALLNRITHAFVKEEIERRIRSFEAAGVDLLLLDVPLLFESGIDNLCDLLICVTADEKTRIARIVQRDTISEEQALQRIRTQIDAKTLINKTDFHIRNDSDRITLENQIKEILNKITTKVGI